MKSPSELAPDDLETLRAKILGLGKHSARKSYYPGLRARLSELERFRAALDGSNDAILLVDLVEGTLDDANETACRMLRRPRDQVIGRPLGELVAALAEHLEHLGCAAELADAQSETVETTLCPPGGGEIPIEATLSLVRGRGERCALVVARDVSERRRGYRALRLLAEAGATVSSSLDVATALANLARVALPDLGDVCGVYHRARGGAIERLALTSLGSSRGEIARALGALEARYREAVGAELGVRRAIETGRAEIIEVTDALLAGSARDAEHLAALRALSLESVLVAPFTGAGASGALLVAAGAGSGRRYDELDVEVARELAQRVSMALANARLYREAQAATTRAEEALAQLDTLLVRTPVGIAFLDAELRYARVNAALAEMVGVPAGTLIGRTSGDLDADLSPAIIREVLATGQPVLDVERSARLSGEHWLTSHYPVRASNEGLLGVGIVVVDITERKRAELERELLLQRERAARVEAERANRLKDEFVATVSHELRTPLSVIQGWTQLVAQPGTTPELLARGLATIERNTRLLAQLVADLLDTSRIVSGKLSVRRTPLDLSTVVDEAIDGLRASAQAKDVELRIDAAPPGDAEVLGDAGRLQQVVSNLVANAIKFTPAAGRVDVTLSRSQDRVVLVVRDTGQGIEPELLPHVFDRFWQANTSMARRHGGLGLGLAIVETVVHLHDGTVRAESAGPDQGACFTVELPAAPLHAAVAHASTAPTHLGGARVLLVEDAPDARALVERILAEHGAEVHAVPSAPEALRALAEHPLDVIVSDIGLPGMDGYELMRQIRAGRVPRAANIPAVALTAFTRPDDQACALRAGFQVHLAKPIDCSVLVAEVAALLCRDQARAGEQGSPLDNCVPSGEHPSRRGE